MPDAPPPNAPQPDAPLLADLRLAHTLADGADRLTMASFGSDRLRVELKPDDTQVTAADRDTEARLRDQLARTRPGDAILGEEYGLDGDAQRRWVLDPIDGTANYVRGVPVWATLIALVEAGRPVLGLVSAPALGWRWWAAAGLGSHRGRSIGDSRPNAVSAVSRLDEAFVSYSSLHGWRPAARRARFEALLDRAGRSRGFGDFFSYMLLAQGAVDLATEPELAVHDVAALVPIVVEAGGRFTSVTGGDPLADGSALASNGALHDAALRALSD